MPSIAAHDGLRVSREKKHRLHTRSVVDISRYTIAHATYALLPGFIHTWDQEPEGYEIVVGELLSPLGWPVSYLVAQITSRFGERMNLHESFTEHFELSRLHLYV